MPAPRSNPSRPRRAARRAAAGFVLPLLLAGCHDPNPEVQAQRRELLELRRTLDERSAELEACRSENAALSERLTRATGVSAEARALLFTVDRLRLASLSGVSDLDGQPGDDGVRVHVQPLDRYGDVIKAAGDFSVELFELGGQDGPRALGRADFPVARIHEYWLGQLMTRHFSFEVPWTAPPAGELTVRVVFSDLLTGRQHSVQQSLERR